MAVLDKGRKNVELLKQNQYSPMSVEKQIAVIYCGTKGLLSEIPVEKIREFESEFLEYMELKEKKTLAALAQGKLSDDITGRIEEAAKEIIEKLK